MTKKNKKLFYGDNFRYYLYGFITDLKQLDNMQYKKRVFIRYKIKLIKDRIFK